MSSWHSVFELARPSAKRARSERALFGGEDGKRDLGQVDELRGPLGGLGARIGRGRDLFEYETVLLEGLEDPLAFRGAVAQAPALSLGVEAGLHRRADLVLLVLRELE